MYMWLCVYVLLHLTSYLVIMNSLLLIKYLIACQTVCVTPDSGSSEQQAADAFVAYLAPDFNNDFKGVGRRGRRSEVVRKVNLCSVKGDTEVFYVLDFNSEGKQTYLCRLIPILQVGETVKRGENQ